MTHNQPLDVLLLYPCGRVSPHGFSWSELDELYLAEWQEYYPPVGECLIIPELLDGERDLNNCAAAWVGF